MMFIFFAEGLGKTSLENHIIFLNLNENNKEILELEVHSSQHDFIESIPQCMKEVCEKSYGIVWHPIGIFNNDCLVGFAMYGKSPSGEVWLDRFMIDKSFQGKGYGKLVLPLLIKKIKDEFDTNILYLSVNEKNNIAINLYKKMGFKFIDELDGNDPVMQYFNE